MGFGSHLSRFLSGGDRSGAPQWISWSSLWRGSLLALCIAFALSTQLLFEFDLYRNWPLSDILLGWLDHFVDQLIVGEDAQMNAQTLPQVKMPNRDGFVDMSRR